MRRNHAKGMSVVASKQHYLARDWIDFNIDVDEPFPVPACPQFVDGAVETGQLVDNVYRPIEFNISAADPYL